MNQSIVPAEPSSLVLMVTGIASIAFFMFVTGQWKEIFRANTEPRKLSLIKASRYAFCEYEQRFVASLNNLTAHGFGQNGLPIRPKSAAI